MGILLYKGERVVIRRLTQRDNHFTGLEYLAIRPSPDDLPLIRRQAQGIKKMPTHAMFIKIFTTLFFSFASGSGAFQFLSNS
jgi:hypothetical protein